MDLFTSLEKQQTIVAPSKTINYAALRKGQRVTLRSGKIGIVEGGTQFFFWMQKESLPYHVNEILHNT